MHILVVNLKVKQECIQDFKAASILNAQSSRTEPGIISFDLLQHKQDPSIFMLYEVYTEPGAQDAHRETEHYKQWKIKTADMFEEPAVRGLFDYAEKL